jgi:uncharacterized protein (TIGR02217 family)
MSDAIFPTLPGLSWDQSTGLEFSTIVKRSTSGQEYRSLGMRYPLWNFALAYGVLRDASYSTPNTELQELAGFYLARQGAFDSFLFNNPNDNTASAVVIGTGNASNTTFQLCRSYGSTFTFNEPVNNANVVSAISFNGVTQNSANYTVSTTGLVTFNASTRPGANVVVTWNGVYYYRCRFVEDKCEFNNMMRGLWELKKLAFVGSPKNKV